MPRVLRPAALLVAALTIAIVAAACGQSSIATNVAAVVPASNPTYKSYVAEANLFHERCGGCHTLSYAATSGSGDNPRTYLDISGPNFNVRCERPAVRVLYAIENGGFGGEYMPANIVVGQQARNLALFVSKFAGREAATSVDSTPCQDQSMGSLPPTLTSGVSTTQAPSTTTNPSNAAGQPNKSASEANPSPNGGT